MRNQWGLDIYNPRFGKVAEKEAEKVTVNAKDRSQGVKLTEKRIAMASLMIDDPYISKTEISKAIGISVAAVSKEIEVMLGILLRHTGPDKGGFWRIIIEDHACRTETE